MKDLFDKTRHFERLRWALGSGFYPYFKAVGYDDDGRPLVEGRPIVMVGSNNYLGLTHDPRVKEAALAATRRYGTSCSGSRFLNGTIDLHVELEGRLARFFEKDEAIVFSTGFQANLGVLSSLVGRDDIVFSDRDNHASIVDGLRLSFGEVKKYRHNDPGDLERLLARAVADEPTGGLLVVTDGMFSMTGRLADLGRIADLAAAHQARLLVDDAHGIGALGAGGRGTCEQLGLLDRVDLLVGTFSKSFASLGGFVAGEKEVLDYIRHISRALIFSAAMPPSAVAAVLAALDIVEGEPERRQRLAAISRRMKAAFDDLGFETAGSRTPVIPVVVGDELLTMEFWHRLCHEEGVYCNAILPPATPPGQALLRTSYIATQTDEELDRVVDAFARVGRSLGLIQ